MSAYSLEQLQQLPRARVAAQQLYAVQVLLPVDILLVAAIGDRETNWRNILGDFHDGVHHGYGYMQLDIGTYPWLPTAKMRDGQLLGLDPSVNVYLGAHQLVELFHAASRVRPDDPLPFCIAAYNAGMERSIRHGDMFQGQPLVAGLDAITTGGDYVSDVLRRLRDMNSAISSLAEVTNVAPA